MHSREGAADWSYAIRVFRVEMDVQHNTLVAESLRHALGQMTLARNVRAWIDDKEKHTVHMLADVTAPNFLTACAVIQAWWLKVAAEHSIDPDSVAAISARRIEVEPNQITNLIELEQRPNGT